MPAAIADAHGGVARSRVTAALAVKSVVVLATRPYGDDGPNERKVGGAVVMTGNGQAYSRRCTMAMAATTTHNVASSGLKRLQWRVREVEQMVVKL